MSAPKEFFVVDCGASMGFAVAQRSQKEGVAFELVAWGLRHADALAKTNNWNERPHLAHLKD